MEVSLIDPARYAEQIRAMRIGLLQEWGLPARGKLLRPLSNGHYLGLFTSPSRSRLIGVCECFLYGSLPAGYCSTPYGSGIDLMTICPPQQMAHVRGIYLHSGYRKCFGTYARLCAGAALAGLRLGIRHTTLMTLASATALHALYQKMGGRILGTLELPGSAIRSTLMVIDLQRLLATPAIRRSMLDELAAQRWCYPSAPAANGAGERTLH